MKLKAGSEPLRVLKTLGGCGGTIVARALEAVGALVLSEVNPRAAHLFGGGLNPLIQVKLGNLTTLTKGWADTEPATLGDPAVFGRFMRYLADTADRPVVIRDYSYVDYLGAPFVWPARPSLKSLDVALAPFGPTHAALLVRHPVENFRSLLQHPPLASTLTSEDFVGGFTDLLTSNPDLPIFHYEEFVRKPDAELRRLCDALALEYSDGWRDGLAHTRTLTGHPRARESIRVDDHPPRAADDEIALVLRQAPGFDALMAQAGYI